MTLAPAPSPRRAHAHSQRRARATPLTLALSGVLIAGGTCLPAAAVAPQERSTVLHPSVTGTDGSVRYSLASLAGGGVQVSFVYVPDESAGETSGRDQAQSKEFTVTVDTKAVATQTVTDDGGTLVPDADTEDDSKNGIEDDTENGADEDSVADQEQAGDSADRADRADNDADDSADDTTRTREAARTNVIARQDIASDSTTITLTASTEGVATAWVLPQQAPAAADPDDQKWLTKTWHALVDKITGDDSDEDQADDDGEQTTEEDEVESAPTATPTSGPTSDATSSPPSSSPTRSPSSQSPSSHSSSSSSSSAASSATRGDDHGDKEEDKDSQDTSNDLGEEGADDTCVVSPGQLTTSTRDGGDGTVDAPLEDGPSAAPTFSEDVRQRAQQAADCGEDSDIVRDDAGDESAGDGQDGEVQEGQGPDRQDTGEGFEDGENTSNTADSSSPSSGKNTVDLQAGDWLSGISGDPDQREPVEELRGVQAETATTWADASGSVSQLGTGSQFGPEVWNKSLILALPPFPEGSSWEATAKGDNDDYLRTTFATAKEKWGERDGQLFIEYGYEMNGYWMWWAAQAGQENAVAGAFERARSIQQEEFPDALLGVRFNHESNGYDGNSEDLIAAVRSSIDFIGASYYNAYPPVFTQAEFDERATMRDGGGGPKGIGTWLQAAKTAGLPIEFGEWAESAKDGDSPAFIDGMHQTFKENAGPGAGQVFAESYFQIVKDDDNWRIDSGRVPQSAKAYAEAFSDVGGS